MSEMAWDLKELKCFILFERQSEVGNRICNLLLAKPETWISSHVSQRMTGTQVRERLLLPSRVCLSRKAEWEKELRLEPRHLIVT